jgi:hypothetical protein
MGRGQGVRSEKEGLGHARTVSRAAGAGDLRAGQGRAPAGDGTGTQRI